jgi:hypothetical protein
MNREGHENIKFFYGTEVEHTPAFGKKTLFVVGVQSADDIAANIQGCEHIYFGANQSFPNIDSNDYVKWSQWENMILYFLQKGYLCTLDIDVRCVEGLLESSLTEDHNFIQMISVKLAYIKSMLHTTLVPIQTAGAASMELLEQGITKPLGHRLKIASLI